MRGFRINCPAAFELEADGHVREGHGYVELKIVEQSTQLRLSLALTRSWPNKNPHDWKSVPTACNFKAFKEVDAGNTIAVVALSLWPLGTLCLMQFTHSRPIKNGNQPNFTFLREAPMLVVNKALKHRVQKRLA